MKKLDEMNKKEKKEFLSMDLVERLIRLEQRVSASFGKFIPYSETEYFKQLPEKEKKKFKDYLKRHKRRKFVLGFFLSFVILGAIILRGAITARVIEDNLPIPKDALGIFFVVFSVFFLLIITLSLIFKTKRERKVNHYFDIFNKIYFKK